MLIARVGILDQLGLPLWAQVVFLVILFGYLAFSEWESHREGQQLIHAQLKRQHASNVVIRRDWSTLSRPMVFDVRYLTPAGERMYNRCTFDPSADSVMHWDAPLS